MCLLFITPADHDPASGAYCASPDLHIHSISDVAALQPRDRSRARFISWGRWTNNMRAVFVLGRCGHSVYEYGESSLWHTPALVSQSHGSIVKASHVIVSRPVGNRYLAVYPGGDPVQFPFQQAFQDTSVPHLPFLGSLDLQIYVAGHSHHPS